MLHSFFIKRNYFRKKIFTLRQNEYFSNFKLLSQFVWFIECLKLWLDDIINLKWSVSELRKRNILTSKILSYRSPQREITTIWSIWRVNDQSDSPNIEFSISILFMWVPVQSRFLLNDCSVKGMNVSTSLNFKWIYSLLFHFHFIMKVTNRAICKAWYTQKYVSKEFQKIMPFKYFF